MNGAYMLSFVAFWLCAPVLPQADSSASCEQSPSPDPLLSWLPVNEPLCRTVAKLAKSQGKNPDEYVIYPADGAYLAIADGGWDALVRSNGATYRVFVQTERLVPETSAQWLVLIADNGKILDGLRCEITSWFGVTKTDVYPAPQADGAQVVIRFVGKHIPLREGLTWNHCQHTIRYEGKDYTFRVQGTADKPNIWTEQGLCRARIANDKFEIIFPKRVQSHR